MVEPFRCIIDRRLRKAYNLRQIDPADFFMENGCCRLAWKAQNKYIRLFFKDILSEKEKIFIFVRNITDGLYGISRWIYFRTMR